jgi:hypothetical protein
MSCITSVSFVILINGATTPFFLGERGLLQGCPMSPLLFLLVVEGLNRSIEAIKREDGFHGIHVAETLCLPHLLFVDDIPIFYNGMRRDAKKLKEILDLFT